MCSKFHPAPTQSSLTIAAGPEAVRLIFLSILNTSSEIIHASIKVGTLNSRLRLQESLLGIQKIFKDMLWQRNVAPRATNITQFKIYLTPCFNFPILSIDDDRNPLNVKSLQKPCPASGLTLSLVNRRQF